MTAVGTQSDRSPKRRCRQGCYNETLRRRNLAAYSIRRCGEAARRTLPNPSGVFRAFPGTIGSVTPIRFSTTFCQPHFFCDPSGEVAHRAPMLGLRRTDEMLSSLTEFSAELRLSVGKFQVDRTRNIMRVPPAIHVSPTRHMLRTCSISRMSDDRPASCMPPPKHMEKLSLQQLAPRMTATRGEQPDSASQLAGLNWPRSLLSGDCQPGWICRTQPARGSGVLRRQLAWPDVSGELRHRNERAGRMVRHWHDGKVNAGVA